MNGLMTVCHDARKGRYTGSHWPNHVRASTPLDEIRVSSIRVQTSLRVSDVRDAKPAADAGVVIVRDPDGHALQLARVGHSLAGK